MSLKSMKVTYSGNFVGGKYHGSGTLTSTLGVFEGTFEHGRQTYGKLEYDNHDFYEGQFKLGLKHGEGKMISQDGIYNGQWVKDLKEGKGSMIYCDGSSYEGNWSLGMRHGKGTWTNSNKGFIASYNGDWVYDTREGSGEIVYNTGDKYVGAIVAGQPHGNGKMILASGVVLEGKFVNGVMEGKVDILNPEKAVVSVLENGQMVGETEGVEILVPPFLPVLQF
uniref:MORN repeat-containing protein n=1 Tax=Arcella intermedia TaxID=1963864 RepID=A0A6B2LET3_9EUKA